MRGGQMMAIAAGACLGTWARAGVGLVMGGFAATVTVNLLGALALGTLRGWRSVRPSQSGFDLAAGTGFCGAFTTYSSMVLVIDSPTPAVGVMGISALLIAGVGVAALGIWAGARLGRADGSAA